MNQTQQDPVGIVGAGHMGAGIAQRAVEHGLAAVLCTRDASRCEAIAGQVARGAKMSVRRRRASEDAVAAGLDRLRVVTALADLADCPIVIEAIIEEWDAKVDVFKRLAEALPKSVTLATNTSALSVECLGVEAGVSERLVGLHFMNPVPGSKLVELVRHDQVDPAHLDRARTVAVSMGLEVLQLKDSQGFLVNRLLMPLIVEAARTLQEGVGDAQAIDTAMRLGCGHPMGPLALADFIGLDVILAELDELAAAHGARYEPPRILRDHVCAGHLGRKTGRGFHSYGA